MSGQGWRRKLGGRQGQMTVELCVVLPVAIVIAVIATNALSFFATCAEFDRVARNAVRTVATAPAYGGSTDQSAQLVTNTVEGSFDATNLACDVSVEKDYRGYETYQMTLVFTPTLFGIGLVNEVFGVSLPRLTHETRLVVSPYKPGIMF